MFSELINQLNIRDCCIHVDTVNCYIREIIGNFCACDFLLAGKRLRTKLLLKFSKKISEKHYQVAAILEILHAASLLHDDVIDNNLFRRDGDSFLKINGYSLSVLFGDLLFAKCARYIKFDEFVRKIMFKTCETTVLGAILEQKSDIASVQGCVKIAAYKTGALFQCAAALGCYLSGDSFINIKKAATVGKCFGILYQFQNDLNGYKPVNYKESEDYVKKNITLPIILSKYPIQDFVENTSQDHYLSVQKSVFNRQTQQDVRNVAQKYYEIVANCKQFCN